MITANNFKQYDWPNHPTPLQCYNQMQEFSSYREIFKQWEGSFRPTEVKISNWNQLYDYDVIDSLQDCRKNLWGEGYIFEVWTGYHIFFAVTFIDI